MSTLSFLSSITIVLFIGLIIGVISKKLKIPSMLLLILTGAVLKNLTFDGVLLFNFEDEFLITASILALVMIVFEGSSNFTLHDLNTYTQQALKIVIIVIAVNMLFLSIFTYFLFDIKSMILSLLFAAVMSGTDPGSVLSIFQEKTNKITEILKFESIINTPIVVLIPFILLGLFGLDFDVTNNFVAYFSPFMQQIITGIGTGVFLGLIIFKFMREFYSDKLSPLALITGALLTYILAETLGGNGVLAVTTFGIFFGNIRVKKKLELKVFSNMFSNVLEILVFILIGYLLPLNLSPEFIGRSLLLFGGMIILRFAAIFIAHINEKVNIKEKMFMTLTCAKGIAVAVVAFILSTHFIEIPVIRAGTTVLTEVPLIEYAGGQVIIDLMILFILYSIILSSITARFSQKFIRLKVEE